MQGITKIHENIVLQKFGAIRYNYDFLIVIVLMWWEVLS